MDILNLLNNIKTGPRLFMAFSFLLAMILAGTGVAVYGINSMDASVSAAAKEALKIKTISDVQNDINVVFHTMDFIMLTEDQTKTISSLATIEAAQTKYHTNIELLKSMATTDEGKRLLASLEDSVAKMEKAHSDMLQLTSEGKNSEAHQVYDTKSKENRTDLEKVLSDLIAWRVRRLNETRESANQTLITFRLILIGLGGLGFLIAIVATLLMTSSVTQPLDQASKQLKALAEGDFAGQVNSALLRRRDEMGDMGRALDLLINSLRSTIGEVKSGIQILASSSTALTAISEEVSAGAGESHQNAELVAASAREMSAKTASVVNEVEHASSSLTSVATATEEMTSTIGEIAASSERARATTLEAAREADRVSASMKELGEAAREIGKVTETITHISSQTNLLALNSTIEAARAGSAGKGFAVVAGEIKELAQQSAAATEEIKDRIASVQNTTAGAVENITKIVKVIREINDIVTQIATAIEEQTVMTRDIAGNIAQASEGVKNANLRVGETAVVTQDITREIIAVSSRSSEISAASEQVESSAQELSSLAEQLRLAVSKFSV